MRITMLDHVFVGLVLVLIFPVAGLWSYRRFLKRAELDGEPALIREYRATLIWLGTLLLTTVAVWIVQGRPLAALYGRLPVAAVDPGFATPVSAGLLIAICIRPILAFASSNAAAKLRRVFERLAPFLPKSRRALLWGFAVSVAAGVAEEIAYRGFLLPYTEALLPLWVAIAAAALLFGVAHLYQGFGGVAATTVLGGLLAGIYLATGSLLIPVLLHTAVDLSSMLTAYAVLRGQGS